MTQKLNAQGIDKRTDAFLPKAIHSPSSDRALIIDGMGLVYAAYHSYSKLSFGKSSTSILFGVPKMLKSILLKFPTNKIIVCWDGDRHKKRLKILPTYKSHRDSKRDPVEHAKMHKQVRGLRKLLFALGIPQAYDKKVEGDDMVYFVAKDAVKTSRLLIFSGDKDMCQLINHDISVLHLRTGELITPFAFKGTFPVELPQFIDYLCLCGDKSDDIPNYTGFGPATSRRFFESFYSVKQYIASSKDFSGLADKEGVVEHYKRNRRLIDLKFFCERYYAKDYTPRFYAGSQFPNYDPIKYRSICLKYNLKTLLDPKFIKAFDL